MLTVPPPKYRPRRPRPMRKAPTPTPPPAALVLVAAEFGEATWVRLAFDRAIDVAGLDGAQITIDDGPVTEFRWAATGAATLLGPAVVRIDVALVGPSTAPSTTLTATAASGIVAADDGGTWAGVTNLGLPFP